MKKNITILLLLILCACGCSNNNKFEKFRHYNSNDYNLDEYDPIRINRYSYINQNGENYEYVITDISSENSEAKKEGLFYKISEDDYILLDEIDSCGYPKACNNNRYTYFYNDKLYIIRCSGGIVLEYDLSGYNITKKDLLPLLNTNLRLTGIDYIDNEYMYYEGSINYTGPHEKIKCSKNNYTCEPIEDKTSN